MRKREFPRCHVDHRGWRIRYVSRSCSPSPSSSSPASSRRWRATRHRQKGRLYSPGKLTVKSGAVLVFENDDNVTHHVYSSTKGHEFKLETVPPGREGQSYVLETWPRRRALRSASRHAPRRHRPMSGPASESCPSAAFWIGCRISATLSLQSRLLEQMAHRLVVFVILTSGLLSPSHVCGQYVMENLGRGVVAIRASETTVYVGWRLLGTDPAEIAFNVYRSTDGGAPSKLNAAPITATTDFVDSSADLSQTNVYTVRPVRAGRELAASAPPRLRADAPIQQFLTVPLQRPAGGEVDVPAGARTVNYTYSPNDTSVADLDGDGEYEIVVKWDPSNARDTASPGLSGRATDRCLPAGRYAPVAHRSRPEHPRRRPLHAVHRLRPRRRRPRRSGVQDGRRHGGRPGARHRRRVEGLSLAGGADRRRAGDRRGRPPLREGARRSGVLHDLRRAHRRGAGDDGLYSGPRAAGRVGRDRRQRRHRQQRQPRGSIPRRRRLPRRPAPERDHGARLLWPHRSRGLGLAEGPAHLALGVRFGQQPAAVSKSHGVAVLGSGQSQPVGR